MRNESKKKDRNEKVKYILYKAYPLDKKFDSNIKFYLILAYLFGPGKYKIYYESRRGHKNIQFWRKGDSNEIGKAKAFDDNAG